MSTNELRAGRQPTQIVWPDDRVTVTGQDGCVRLQMIDIPGELFDTQMIEAQWEDGSMSIINPRYVAMIDFND